MATARMVGAAAGEAARRGRRRRPGARRRRGAGGEGGREEARAVAAGEERCAKAAPARRTRRLAAWRSGMAVGVGVPRALAASAAFSGFGCAASTSKAGGDTDRWASLCGEN